MYRAQEITLSELTRLLGTLTSTIQAILPARLQFLYLQQQQIARPKRSASYMATVTLNAMANKELAWCIKNLESSNGWVIIQPPSQILMQTDTSKKGWGAMCQGIRNGSLRSKKEQENHINLLELLAIKSALLTFKFQISTYLGKQLNCLELPLKDESDKESGTFQSFEGDLGLSSQTSDHDYCGVPLRLPEPSGRLGIEKSKGLQIMSASIPENLSDGGSTRDRFICFSVAQLASGLLLMEATPKQFGPRCIATNLVP